MIRSFSSYLPKALVRLTILLTTLCWFNQHVISQSQKATSKPKYEYSTPELKAAEALYKNKKYREALAAFEDIIQKAQKAENYEEVVYAIEKKALSLRRLGRFDKTIETMDKAIALALEKLPKKHMLISRMYYTRGTTEHDLLKYYSARSYFDTAISLYNKASTYDSSLLYRLVEYKYYSYQYSEGNFDTLTQYLNKLEKLENLRQLKTPRPNTVLRINQAYSIIYSQKGDFERDLYYSIKGLKYVEEHRTLISNRYVAESYFYLIKALYHKEEYSIALKVAQDVIPIFESTPRDQMPEYYAFNNLLAAIFMGMKSYDEALTHLERAKQSIFHRSNENQKIGKSIFHSIVLINIGVCYQEKGNYEEARLFYEKALNLLKQRLSIPSTDFRAIYNRFGNYYFNQKKWHKAFVSYDSALRNSLKNYTDDLINFPSNNVEIPFRSLNILTKKAKSLLFLSLTKINITPLLRTTENHIDKIHELLVEGRENLFASEGKLKLEKDFKSSYETGVHSSLELYLRTNEAQYLDKGLTHMSRGKAQLFLEQMGDLESLRGREVPKELRLSFALASQKIDSLDIEVSTLLNIDPLDQRLPPVLEERIQWNDQLDSMKKVVSALYKAPEKEVSVDIIRQQYNLNSDKAFVEFIDGDSLIFAIGVSGDKTSFRKVKKDESFKVAFTRLLKEVSVAPQGAYTEHLNNFGQSASSLYQSLVAPIVDDLGSVKELIIVPDGELTKLPFDLLVSEWTGAESSFKELKYLLKEINVTHLLSSKINFETDNKKGGKGILGFGYVGEGFTDERAEMGNLPGALEEIDFLKAKFDGDYFTGEKGTKQEFLKQADDYDVIHLAIHGKSDSTNRFKSSLVFNGDKDYYLTSTDLYSTNLQSKLAVLSACETGVGQLSKGEGTFSIARGFAMAGVPAIVTTLWKVNDIAGAKITQAFYQGLEQGFNKDEALRKAKLSFLEQSNNITESPFYWGNYILIGDPVPIELKKKNSSIQWMILMGVLLLAVGVVVSKRRKKLSHAA